jgi:hypothetical protein
VVMEWVATITGDHVGYPGFRDLGDFSPRRKILGCKNSHVFRHRIFAVASLVFVLNCMENQFQGWEQYS